ADLEEVVEYELIGGNKGNLTRTMCVMHIVNHSSYHRGWISDMFGQADALQPTTDIPVFERARREAGGPLLPV
ncbi:MAG: DinB family protein, partial [Alphaproteobacteria bacterium]